MGIPENTVAVVMGVSDHSTTVWYPNLGGNLREISENTGLKPGDWTAKFDGELVKIRKSLPTTIAKNSPLFKITTLVLKPALSYFSEGRHGFSLREYSSFVGLSVYFGPVMLSRTVSRRMKENTLYELELLNFKQTACTSEQVKNTWAIMDKIKTLWFSCSWPNLSEKELPRSLILDEMEQDKLNDYSVYLEGFANYRINFIRSYQKEIKREEELETNTENIPTSSVKNELEEVDSWIRNLLTNQKMRAVMEQRDPETYCRIRRFYKELK